MGWGFQRLPAWCCLLSLLTTAGYQGNRGRAQSILKVSQWESPSPAHLSPQQPPASTSTIPPKPRASATHLSISPPPQICPLGLPEGSGAAVWGSGQGDCHRSFSLQVTHSLSHSRSILVFPGMPHPTPGNTILTPPGVKLGAEDPQCTFGLVAVCSELSWWAHWPWPVVS